MHLKPNLEEGHGEGEEILKEGCTFMSKPVARSSPRPNVIKLISLANGVCVGWGGGGVKVCVCVGVGARTSLPCEVLCVGLVTL